MDVWEFLARSEWPIVVGVGIWFVRRPLAEMLDRVNLTKVEALGFNVFFERGIEKVQALVATEPALVVGALKVQQEGDRLMATAEVHEGVAASDTAGPDEGIQRRSAGALVRDWTPEVLIITAWYRLERFVEKRFVNTLLLWRDDPNALTAFATLQQLRDRALRESPTYDQALEFERSVDALIRRIELLPSRNDSKGSTELLP